MRVRQQSEGIKTGIQAPIVEGRENRGERGPRGARENRKRRTGGTELLVRAEAREVGATTVAARNRRCSKKKARAARKRRASSKRVPQRRPERERQERTGKGAPAVFSMLCLILCNAGKCYMICSDRWALELGETFCHHATYYVTSHAPQSGSGSKCWGEKGQFSYACIGSIWIRQGMVMT